MIHNSAKTAICRIRPSSPTIKIQSITSELNRQIKKLDFGCGRGYDAEYWRMDKWDPYWYNVDLKNKYEIITCTYVFNVIEQKEEIRTLDKIKSLLSNGGKSYISVRRDKLTSKIQRNVFLDLPVFYQNSRYCIYLLK